ncbi:MAG: hypothetical protein OXL34_04005 [Gemmatimonadota bacterium]|nr:hypothetical protein [Gemmatimonadota bacterium]
MAHLIGLRRSRGDMRPLVGVAIGLSLIVGITIESTHTHTGTELSVVCSVCKLPHQDATASVPGESLIVASSLVSAPALPGRRLVPGIVHLSPYRSRAPPLPISL